MRRSSRMWRRSWSRVMPVTASALSNAAADPARALELVDAQGDLDRIRLRRLEAIDFGEHQRPLDQPLERVAERIGRAGRRLDQVELQRGVHVRQRDRLAADDRHDAIDDLSVRRSRRRRQRERDHLPPQGAKPRIAIPTSSTRHLASEGLSDRKVKRVARLELARR